MTTIKVPCPKCGYRFLMARARIISRDEQVRQTYTAEILDPDAPLVCAACGYEGAMPEAARMMLLGEERLPGM